MTRFTISRPSPFFARPPAGASANCHRAPPHMVERFPPSIAMATLLPMARAYRSGSAGLVLGQRVCRSITGPLRKRWPPVT